jgi:hypothetical protein
LRCHLQVVWSQSSQIPRDFSCTDLGPNTPRSWLDMSDAEVEGDQTSLCWRAMVYQKRRFRVSVELSLTCTADLRMGCTPGCCENWQLTSSDLGDTYSDRLMPLNPFWFWLLTNYHLMSTNRCAASLYGPPDTRKQCSVTREAREATAASPNISHRSFTSHIHTLSSEHS